MATDIMVMGKRPSFLPAKVTMDEEFVAPLSGQVFPMLSIKGSKWSVRKDGEELPLKTPDGKYRIEEVTAVVIAANPGMYKAYYDRPYEATSKEIFPPTCWSANGETPSHFAAKKQSTLCLNCPKNQFGSKINESGKKVKACGDSKRLLLLPYSEEHGLSADVHMISLPIMSLKNWEKYRKELAAHGANPTEVVTRFSFDDNSEYPLLHFRPDRWLEAAEYKTIMEVRESPDVVDFRKGELNTEVVVPVTEAEVAAEPAKEAPAKPRPTTKPRAAAPTPEPVKEAPAEEPVDEELAALQAETDDFLANTDF